MINLAEDNPVLRLKEAASLANTDALVPTTTRSSSLLTASMANRLGIAATGVVIAVTFAMPNMMMSDSGSPKALRAARWGINACLCFFVGGIVGAFLNTWKALLPGVLCQIVAFMLVG
jgi:hypothetical protein